MKTRQEYNKGILKKHNRLLQLIEEKYPETIQQIESYIDQYPQQRFGQIICNYVAYDYRDQGDISKKTTDIMDVLFYDIGMDPFFEESRETYIRLKEVDVNVARILMEQNS